MRFGKFWQGEVGVTGAAVLGRGDANVTPKVYARMFDRDSRNEKIRQALSAAV